MLAFPNIDPVAIQFEIIHLGIIQIRWYSLAYIAGIISAWWIISRENAKNPLKNLSGDALDNIILWAVGGIILGGRLGYVLFYKPEYFLNNPKEVFYLWEGGMSFHGGLLGTIFAFYLFCRKYRIAFLSFMDILSCVSPIGLFFGRIANFINGELFGRVTDSPLGMIFPRGGDLPRHPSQLYEAALEGLFLFIIMMWLLKKTDAREKAGYLSGMFLILYSLARIFCEYFREPDSFIGFLYVGTTMGQWLSIPMLFTGLYLIRRKKHES